MCNPVAVADRVDVGMVAVAGAAVPATFLDKASVAVQGKLQTTAENRQHMGRRRKWQSGCTAHAEAVAWQLETIQAFVVGSTTCQTET